MDVHVRLTQPGSGWFPSASNSEEFAVHRNSTEPKRSALVAMVPPRLPNPAGWVTFTGLLEIGGAIGLSDPAYREARGGMSAVVLFG
jgi:hypothetical protein